MLAALAVVVPLGLGAAVSPVMLTEQTVLLAGPGGTRAATRYAVGVVGTLLVIVGALVLFGRAISLPTEPQLDATLDLVVGAALLAVAAVVVALRRRPRPHHEHATLTDRAALPFGVFSMVTNFTTLALLVPAAKEISSSESSPAARLVLVAILVALAGLPAWGPVALTRAAPTTAHRTLAAAGAWIDRHGRTLVVALLTAAGVFFLARGVLGLLDQAAPVTRAGGDAGAPRHADV